VLDKKKPNMTQM